MFAIEKGMPGFKVARPLKKPGWLSSDTAELVFEDCFVPEENLLGEEGRGFYALVRNLQNERIVLAAQALGEAMKAIELTLDWVKQRRAFGATLWDKQAIRQRLAMRRRRSKLRARCSTTPPGATRSRRTSSRKCRC